MCVYVFTKNPDKRVLNSGEYNIDWDYEYE